MDLFVWCVSYDHLSVICTIVSGTIGTWRVTVQSSKDTVAVSTRVHRGQSC